MTDTFHFSVGGADAPFILGAVPNPRADPPREDRRADSYIGETEKNALGSDGELVQAVSDKVHHSVDDDPFGAGFILYDM
jgi:hypothetical protein